MKERYNVKDFVRHFHSDAIEAVLEEMLSCTLWQVKAEPVVIEEDIRIYADLPDDEGCEYGNAIQWAVPVEPCYIGIFYTVNEEGFTEDDKFDTLDEAESAYQKAIWAKEV